MMSFAVVTEKESGCAPEAAVLVVADKNRTSCVFRLNVGGSVHNGFVITLGAMVKMTGKDLTEEVAASAKNMKRSRKCATNKKGVIVVSWVEHEHKLSKASAPAPAPAPANA
jgi:hypothetical protein